MLKRRWKYRTFDERGNYADRDETFIHVSGNREHLFIYSCSMPGHRDATIAPSFEKIPTLTRVIPHPMLRWNIASH
jgi:hypothetical protein